MLLKINNKYFFFLYLDDSYTAIAIEKLNDVVTHERKYSITLEEVRITDAEPESLRNDSNLRQKMYEIRDLDRYDHLSQILFILFL